jgi:hypothetical protein
LRECFEQLCALLFIVIFLRIIHNNSQVKICCLLMTSARILVKPNRQCADMGILEFGQVLVVVPKKFWNWVNLEQGGCNQPSMWRSVW